jgi:hypothetical protein
MPVTSTEAARALAERRHSLDTYIASIVRRAPELTAAQRDRLATILAPARSEARKAGGGPSAA